MIGFIALAGIAACNGILKVGHTNGHAIGPAARGQRAFGPDLMVRGSPERPAPELTAAVRARGAAHRARRIGRPGQIPKGLDPQSADWPP